MLELRSSLALLIAAPTSAKAQGRVASPDGRALLCIRPVPAR